MYEVNEIPWLSAIISDPITPVVCLVLVILFICIEVAKRDAILTKDFNEHNKPIKPTTKEVNDAIK